LGRVLKVLLGFAVLITLFEFVISQIKFDGLSRDVEENLSAVIGDEVIVEGDTYISFFPTPSISVSELRFNNKHGAGFEIPKMKLYLSVWSLLKGNVDVYGAKISNANFNYNIIKKLENISSGNGKGITYIKIDKSSYQLMDRSFSVERIEDINGFIDFSTNSLSIDLRYKINGEDLVTMGSFPFDDGKQSTFELNGGFFSLNYLGELNKKNDSFNISGDYKITFDDTFAGEMNVFMKSLIRDGLRINGKIDYNSDKLILDNIEIHSNNIEKITGSLSFIEDVDGVQDINSYFKGGSINLDAILGTLSGDDGEKVKLYKFVELILGTFNLDVPEKMKGKADVSFTNVVYNSEEVTDISMVSHFLGDKMVVNSLGFNFPGEGKFFVEGSLEDNDIRARFIGDSKVSIKSFKDFEKWVGIDIKYPEKLDDQIFNYSGQIYLFPKNVEFKNGAVSWGDFNLNSDVRFSLVGDDTFKGMITLELSGIDASDFGITEFIDRNIINLYVSDIDKTGEIFYDATGGFKWLRFIPFATEFDITFNNMKYKNSVIDNFNILGDVKRNNFIIDSVTIKSNPVNMHGKMNLILSSVKPSIAADIKFKYLNTERLGELLPSFVAMKKIANVALNQDKNAEKIYTIGDVNLFGINNVSVQLDVAADELDIGDLKINNLNSKIVSNFGILAINNLDCEAFGGSINFIGNIGLSTNIASYNGNYNLYNVKLRDILTYYGNYSNVDAELNVSGTMASRGINAKAFAVNLSGDFQVLGRELIVRNYDLSEIIKLSEYKSPFSEKIDKINYYSNSGESFFDDLVGSGKFSDGYMTLSDFTMQNDRGTGGFSATVDVFNKLINSHTRFEFIPKNRGTRIGIDITSSGKLDALNVNYQYDSYLTFLRDTSTTSDINRNIPRYLMGVQ